MTLVATDRQPRWWHPEWVRISICTPLVLVAAYLTPGHISIRILASWDAFAVAMLFLTWRALRGRNLNELTRLARRSRRRARLADWLGMSSGALTQGSVSMAMTATITVLPRTDEMGLEEPWVVLLCVIGVVTSWMLAHTGYLSIYVDEYVHNGGLDFPGDEEPAIEDFVYFAFGVGTSFGATDVTVTRRRFRQHVLGHAVLSFILNTTILAIAVTFVTTYLSTH